MSSTDPNDPVTLALLLAELRAFRAEAVAGFERIDSTLAEQGAVLARHGAALKRIETSQLAHGAVIDRIDRLARKRDEDLDERLTALEEPSSQS